AFCLCLWSEALPPTEQLEVVGKERRMQLRQHPKLIGRWPPKRPIGSSYHGVQARITIEPLSEAALIHSVADCPPLTSSADVQGIVLYTDRGTGVIVAADAKFREHLFHTLQTCLGLSLQEIGDVEIDF